MNEEKAVAIIAAAQARLERASPPRATIAKTLLGFVNIINDPRATAEQKRRAQAGFNAATDGPAKPAAKPRAASLAPAPPSAAQLAANSELHAYLAKRRDFSAEQRAAIIAMDPVSGLAFARATDYQPQLTDAERALLAKSSPKAEATRVFTQGSVQYTPFVTPDEARKRLAEMDAEKIAKDAEDSFPTAPSPRPGGPEWLERSRNEREPTTFVNRTPYLPQTWDRR